MIGGHAVRRTAHLARRWLLSLRSRPPAPADEAWAESMLVQGEVALWRRLSDADRAHSLLVARRLVGTRAAEPPVPRTIVAGALLHDVGKLSSDLGTTMRVIATLIGPRGPRFAAYHDHVRLGADMLAEAGSDAATIEVVVGRGPWAEALQRADDI